MIHRPFHFVADSPALEAKLCALKQESCPHCGRVETLNRHSLLRGNDPDQPGAQSLRGQRVHCSDRGQRGGCGKTFALLLAEVFPRHTLSASRIWPWLVELLGGLSLKAASEKLRLPFALESFYRLRRRLGGRLDDLRSRLSREQALRSVRQRAENPYGARSSVLATSIEFVKGTRYPVEEFCRAPLSFLGGLTEATPFFAMD